MRPDPPKHLIIVGNWYRGISLTEVLILRIVWRLVPEYRVKSATTGIVKFLRKSKASNLLKNQSRAARPGDDKKAPAQWGLHRRLSFGRSKCPINGAMFLYQNLERVPFKSFLLPRRQAPQPWSGLSQQLHHFLNPESKHGAIGRQTKILECENSKLCRTRRSPSLRQGLRRGNRRSGRFSPLGPFGIQFL